MRAFVIFGVASLAAIAAGCVAMAESGVPASSWMRSVVAWVVGGVLAAVLARSPRGVVVAGSVALLAMLFAQPIDGVHRWIDIGPLHVNVAALFLPALIVGLAVIGIESRLGIASTIVIATVLLLQPDASQLTAFAIAGFILTTRTSWRVVAIAVAIAGWMRPDPLQPVAEVEQIFSLCMAVSPLLALIAGLALTATAVAPLVSRSKGAIALTAYFVAVSLAPFVGAFPVPLVGLGMSFPVGWWLAMGLLGNARPARAGVS